MAPIVIIIFLPLILHHSHFLAAIINFTTFHPAYLKWLYKVAEKKSFIKQLAYMQASLLEKWPYMNRYVHGKG